MRHSHFTGIDMAWNYAMTVICLLFLAAAAIYFAVPYLIGKYQRTALAKNAERKMALVLSFDDGPGRKATPAILEMLARHKAKATFFLLGRNIKGREDIVRQIAEDGHEICSHGYEHLHYWKVSPVRAICDIRRGWRAIDAALGTNRGVYPFRPPYGKLDILTFLYLSIRRVPIIYWTLDTGDTRRPHPPAQQIANRAREMGGAVVLAHDFDRDDKSIGGLVLELTKLMLETAEDTGVQLMTVSELLSP